MDVRLEAGLRAVLATYKGQLAAADRRAKSLAASRDLQRALLRRDRRQLRRLVAANRGVRLETPTLKVGPPHMIAPGTRVAIVNSSSVVGTLVSGVPLTRSALARLRGRSGLDPSDRLVVLHHGRIVGGPHALTGAELATPGSAETFPVNGTRYRTLATTSREGSDKPAIALLTPQHEIDHAVMQADKRLLIGLLLSLLLIALVAYALGRSIVASLDHLATAANAIARGRLDRRVEVEGGDEFARLGTAFNEMADQLEARLAELDAERARMRDSTVRFGDALAATHDVDQLLRVIVETVVEATDATGGIIVGLGGEIVQSGNLSPPRRDLRAAAHRRPPELRHAHPLRPRLLGRAAAHCRLARGARGGRARERAAAPDRRPPGARRHAHRARQPPSLRGGARRAS